MTWRLIFRNITRNRKNSMVIFLLIALICFLFFIGNSIIGQTNTGLRTTYIDSLTADVMIQKNGDMSMNLFGTNSPVTEELVAAIPTLPAYDTIMNIITSEAAIENHTSQISSRSFLEMPELSEGDEPALICGIEPDTYFNCFPGIVVEEGRTLKNGEYGAMITASRADRMEQETGKRPAIGSPMKFTSAGNSGFRIREVPLVGIYHYRNPGQFMNEIVLTDPQTARVLAAIQVATAPAADVLEDPFADINWNNAGTPEVYTNEGFNPEDLIMFLGKSGSEETADLSGGDWNFILLRLKPGVSPALFINELNKKLNPFNVYASGWRTAAGTSAIMMLLVQTFFNIGGSLVSIAGIIVIVNILLISVFRRTREIGTLRAIGAPDSYIRFLVMGENCLLAFFAGITGVLAGSLFLFVINSMNITIPNELAASLLGGRILRIGFLPLTALVSFSIALLLGAAASIYPVETAVRFDPVTAVRLG